MTNIAFSNNSRMNSFYTYKLKQIETGLFLKGGRNYAGNNLFRMLFCHWYSFTSSQSLMQLLMLMELNVEIATKCKKSSRVWDSIPVLFTDIRHSCL